jgi:hypothetical protein
MHYSTAVRRLLEAQLWDIAGNGAEARFMPDVPILRGVVSGAKPVPRPRLLKLTARIVPPGT